MEEMENPVETVQEELHHHAVHSKDSWVGKVALTSALLAAFAAVSSLMAGYHANEAMIKQIQASDKWAYYQAKGIKGAIAESTQNAAKVERYKNEQEEISREAHEREEASEHHLQRHEYFARGVTLFQLAIAVAAVSVLSNRKKFWFLSIAFGGLGLIFFGQGFL